MAEILLGRKVGSSETRVVKRMLPRLTSDPDTVQRFLAEARLALALDHPNVVRAIELDEHAAEPLLVMEHLRGANLGRILRALAERGERLPLELGVEIVAKACAGLHYAHERRGADGRPLGIVHRDVSPYNVMIGFDGSIKLIDFGIAKGAQRAPATRTGTLRGTLPYMSPEQCRSEPVDRRSDVFAASILLWELTVGRPLYPRGSDLDTLNAITGTDAPPPSRSVPGYPLELEAIVMKGLARAPRERFQTIAELGAALEPHLPPRAASSAPLGARVRTLFPDEVEEPRLLAWLPPRAAFAEGPRTEDLRAPDRAPRRGGTAVGIVAAGLAVAALTVMTFGGRDRESAHPRPAVTKPPVVAAPVASPAPSSVGPTAPPPNAAATVPAPAAVTRGDRARKRSSTHRPLAQKHPRAAARARFDLDGPGLPDE
jgi:hypothetical protein